MGLSCGTMHWFHIIRPAFRHLPICHSCSPCEKNCRSGLLLPERQTLVPPVTQPGCWPVSDLWHQVRGRFYSPLWAVGTAASNPTCVAECHKDNGFGASAKPSQVPEPHSLGPGIRHVSLGGQKFRQEWASPVYQVGVWFPMVRKAVLVLNLEYNGLQPQGGGILKLIRGLGLCFSLEGKSFIELKNRCFDGSWRPTPASSLGNSNLL